MFNYCLSVVHLLQENQGFLLFKDTLMSQIDGVRNSRGIGNFLKADKRGDGITGGGCKISLIVIARNEFHNSIQL